GLDLPPDRTIDGRDIFGLLSGKEKSTPHEALYFYRLDDLEGIRVGKWKYYRAISLYKFPAPINKSRASGKVGELPLLYDMEIDPGESYNLAKRHPDIVEQMETLMKAWEEEMKRNPGGWIA
ncbi:MAG: hypothetical protein HY801_08580, partial [Candidatus Lindowbacteria bacterium]|nr:hypothetical protein [Candidatus Lindowbacteria bacterium]